MLSIRSLGQHLRQGLLTPGRERGLAQRRQRIRQVLHRTQELFLVYFNYKGDSTRPTALREQKMSHTRIQVSGHD